MGTESLEKLLARAVAARADLFDSPHEGAVRLFNGFYEGWPDLVVDLYAVTVVLYNYADPPEAGDAIMPGVQSLLLSHLPWVRAVIVKTRQSPSPEARRGQQTYGSEADRRIREFGVWYAVNLHLNRDASLYLDTRNLRAWARQTLAGQTVLNTFAYTGSLGVAALASGAARVVQLDRNRQFLNQGKTSYTLNGFPINKKDFLVGDFWPAVNQLKRGGARFDCVFVDAPFFSATDNGTVDLAQNSARLINKVRPLVNDGGRIVAINNALFVSGQAYLQTLTSLCADGYLEIETFIPVPADVTGYPETVLRPPITDPAPFNHATKIAVLRVRRKFP
jgi:23S rRNA (cytosine1962-C5)-methyltransferase